MLILGPYPKCTESIPLTFDSIVLY
uniref:Uncharacterized protein n=1 Tax=Anguilla anguilla TaxID=7936 RepID=A0A0E9U7J6_ANGAN